MSRHVQLVYGPPGTGKTTYLIQRMEQHLASGVSPERIAFVSFSRRAIREAVDKAKDRFPDSSRTDFPWFRTIHSVAFKLLGLTRDDVLQPRHLREFSRRIGIPIKTGDFHWEGSPGDQALALYHLAAARCTTPEHEWTQAGLPNLPWEGVRYVCREYEQYKRRMSLWDFSDMITAASGTLPVDVLILDESQDTSTAQWKLLRQAAASVPTVHIAGDDDQTIFGWSGADPSLLWHLKGERVVLPQSYRLPQRIKALAESIVTRIRQRVPKAYHATGEAGDVHYLGDVEQLRLQQGRWLLLARSNHQLIPLRELCRRQGVVYTMDDGTWSSQAPAVVAARAYEQLRRPKLISPAQAQTLVKFLDPKPALVKKSSYTWDDVCPGRDPALNWMAALTNMPPHEREYIRALRKSGEPLDGPGRVRISTVHGIKGGEEDNVVLLPDLTPTVAAQARADPDAELRVQYVGVTRAKRTLTLVRPKRPEYWTF